MFKIRSITWGIFIIALWAAVLAILALAQLLELSVIVQTFNSNEGPGQIRIWTGFVFNVVFFFGFAGSAYGLFKQYNWGRLLFLGVIVVWSGFNLLALSPLFSVSQNYTAGELAFNILRYGGTLLLPLVYLNLPWIKAMFSSQSPGNLTSEGTTKDDRIN